MEARREASKGVRVLEESKRRLVRATVCMLFIEAPGRTEARLMRDATALARAGFDVTIVDIEDDVTRSRDENIDGVHFKHIVSPGWYIAGRFKAWFPLKLAVMLVRCAICLMRTPADIYHVHVEKAFLAGYLAAKWRRRPLIFDSPDLPLSDPHLERSQILKRLADHLLRRMIPHCARVVTTSPFYASVLARSYACPGITVIRNVPAYRVVGKSDRLRQYLGLGPEVRIVLYQGNIQPDRELHRVVYAARHLAPNRVIVMMGKGMRGVPERLGELIVREGVEDRVKIIPPVPHAELLEWTASADIGLILFSPEYSLSIRYTLPNKLFEYLMAGVPVLSMELDAIAEVLRGFEVGHVIKSLEAAEIAEGVEYMLARPELLSRMKQNALRAAREKFNWQKEGPGLLELYESVLGSRQIRK